MKKGILLFAVLCLLSINVVSAKEYTCETVDGAYYGKNGDEVDKVQYESECLTHSCEIVGDTYFGKNGDSVSKNTFEKECDATVVSDLPDTGSVVSPIEILFAVMGSLLILITMITSFTYRRVSDKA